MRIENKREKNKRKLTDDVFGDELVGDGVALIQNHEKQVESAHDRRRDGHVGLEGLGAVIAAEDRVSCSQDGGASIQRCLDACDGVMCDDDHETSVYTVSNLGALEA